MHPLTKLKETIEQLQPTQKSLSYVNALQSLLDNIQEIPADAIQEFADKYKKN